MTSSTSTRARVLHVVNRSLGTNLTDHEMAGLTRLDDATPVDSLGLLELVIGLEQEFGTSFDSETFGRDFFLDLDRLVAHLDDVAHSPR